MISKIVKRAAVAAATLGVAGGALFTAGGSASAATLPAGAPQVAAYTHGDHENSYGNNDRYGSYDRYGHHGSYSHGGHYDHGHDGWYRYDGHRFYRLHHGTWTEWTYAGFHHYAR
ncbi:hypothetical protein ACWDA7_35700 [Streptomyces sp. NPDC001156]